MTLPKVTILKKRAGRLLQEYKGYVIRFEGFEEKPGGKYGPTHHYKYTVMNGMAEDGESSKGMPHQEMFGSEARIGTKYYEHLCFLLGVESIDEDTDLDLNPYVGKLYKAIFSHRQDKKDPTKKYNQINKLTKYVRKKK